MVAGGSVAALYALFAPVRLFLTLLGPAVLVFPAAFLADGMPGLTGDRRETKRHAADKWNVEQSYQRHLLQVGAADRFVGALVDRLKDVGIYDRSLVVLTADHGVSFRAGEHVRHATRTTFQDILAVPLFIKAPFQREGRIDDRPSSRRRRFAPGTTRSRYS